MSLAPTFKVRLDSRVVNLQRRRGTVRVHGNRERSIPAQPSDPHIANGGRAKSEANKEKKTPRLFPGPFFT